jgi:hypothetical protein
MAFHCLSAPVNLVTIMTTHSSFASCWISLIDDIEVVRNVNGLSGLVGRDDDAVGDRTNESRDLLDTADAGRLTALA